MWTSFINLNTKAVQLANAKWILIRIWCANLCRNFFCLLSFFWSVLWIYINKFLFYRIIPHLCMKRNKIWQKRRNKNRKRIFLGPHIYIFSYFFPLSFWPERRCETNDFIIPISSSYFNPHPYRMCLLIWKFS